RTCRGRRSGLYAPRSVQEDRPRGGGGGDRRADRSSRPGGERPSAGFSEQERPRRLSLAVDVVAARRGRPRAAAASPRLLTFARSARRRQEVVAMAQMVVGLMGL